MIRIYFWHEMFVEVEWVLYPINDMLMQTMNGTSTVCRERLSVRQNLTCSVRLLAVTHTSIRNLLQRQTVTTIGCVLECNSACWKQRFMHWMCVVNCAWPHQEQFVSNIQFNHSYTSKMFKSITRIQLQPYLMCDVS